MGDFCEKSHFSPLKSWKYLNIAKKSEKKLLAGPGLGGNLMEIFHQKIFLVIYPFP